MQKKDIEDLATLARLNVSDEEMNRFLKDMDGILEYVKQVEEAPMPNTVPSFEHVNIAREDIATDTPEQYVDAILDEMPKRQGTFLEVQRILGGE
jgi:aspartyl-tRNA(Asn)/glutamyl-tRNA(Gln) amidotransferase subunit C